jgi:hypothetical protein
MHIYIYIYIYIYMIVCVVIVEMLVFLMSGIHIGVRSCVEHAIMVELRISKAYMSVSV